MAVEWKILQTERQTSTEGVTTAHWSASDTEVVGVGEEAATHYGSSYGATGFTPDASGEGFVPFADLTEAGVILWVKEALGADEVAAVEQSIAAQIADSKAPVITHGVPW